jgi:hypothetical protein
MALTSYALETWVHISVTRERVSETHLPRCMPIIARPFSDCGEPCYACQHWTPLCREAGPGDREHVTALELTSDAGRGPDLRNVWQCWSPPRQGGGVWSYGTHDDTETLPNREVGSEVTWYVAAPEPTLKRSQGPVRMVRGGAWMHTPLFILTWSIYTEVPSLQGINNVYLINTSGAGANINGEVKLKNLVD